MHASLLGDHSKCDPPDPISNSEVKPLSADGSVGSPHVRVGHRQASNLKPRTLMSMGFFCVCDLILTPANHVLLRQQVLSLGAFESCFLY